MKAYDGTENSLIEPIHIYLRTLNYYTGDALHFYSIVQSISLLSPIGQNLL